MFAPPQCARILYLGRTTTVRLAGMYMWTCRVLYTVTPHPSERDVLVCGRRAGRQPLLVPVVVGQDDLERANTLFGDKQAVAAS